MVVVPPTGANRTAPPQRSRPDGELRSLQAASEWAQLAASMHSSAWRTGFQPNHLDSPSFASAAANAEPEGLMGGLLYEFAVGNLVPILRVGLEPFLEVGYQICRERHYNLVPPEELTRAELAAYRSAARGVTLLGRLSSAHAHVDLLGVDRGDPNLDLARLSRTP